MTDGPHTQVLLTKYGERAAANVEELEQAGCHVMCGVDATNLAASFPPECTFDTIIFQVCSHLLSMCTYATDMRGMRLHMTRWLNRQVMPAHLHADIFPQPTFSTLC